MTEPTLLNRIERGAMPTIKLLAFFLLIPVVGVIMMNLIQRDLALVWVTIPAFVVLNFAAYHAFRVQAGRTPFLLAFLIQMMVMEAIKRWW